MKTVKLINLLILLSLTALLVAGCTSSREGAVAADNPTSDNPSSPPSSTPTATAEADPAPPPPPPDPVLEPLRIPQNTPIHVRLLHAISSRSASSGDSFEAEISQAITVGDAVAIGRGSRVRGRIVSAKPSGRLHNPGALRLTLSEIQSNGRWIPVSTTSVSASGKGHGKRNLVLIGGGSGLGAVIGALAGGGKGAAIGAGSGAAAGTAGAYATGRKDVVFGAEHRLTFKTVRDVVIRKGEKGSGG
jgi:hypothetical protein